MNLLYIDIQIFLDGLLDFLKTVVPDLVYI